ncbi:MAG: prolyl aminopeptidase, partial [Pseudomonadota bacterium]
MYPAMDPYDTRMIEAPDGHTLYCEQLGNPDGVPVIYLHGGPGAGSEPIHRRFHDPETCRLVIFHQRGAGRSRPRARTDAHTTAPHVEDNE